MNTAAARENWEGQIVDGKFPLLKWLGGTERSAVFSTQLPGKDKQAAAIKLLSPDAGTAENQISRWQLAATLEHPNLLRVFHTGKCEISGAPLIYLVMELAEEDLSVVLQTRPLSPEEASEMIPPMLDALSYLHQKGLVHGRIRPSNIMAVGDQLKLSSDRIHALNDFASRDVSPSVFDAPEVARGVTTRAADIWSLGVTLVRCLSQRAQIRESYNPIEQGMAQTIPEPYRRIARECLRPNPNARCTVADIRNWLQPVPATAAAIRQTNKRKSPSIAAMAGIAAVVLLAVIFMVRWATHGKPEAPAETASQQTAPQQTTAEPSPPTAVAPPASVPAKASPAPVAAPAVTPSAPPAYSIPGEVVERAVPTVPANASNTITGKIRVSVRVEVNPAGEVTDASFTTPGPSKYFARLAMEASRRWKFKPAQANGQPVASAWILRYQFTQNATDVVPEELPAVTQ
jgi:TonB family protein